MAARIGELLLKEKRITNDQLQAALEHQRQNGGKLGFNLVKLGFVKDDEITALLSKQYGVPSIALGAFEIDPAIVKLLPGETAQKYQVVPLSRAGATLTIAMTDPTNVFAMDDIRFMTGYNVEPVVASEIAVTDAIEKYYGKVAGGTGTNKGIAAPAGPSALEVASHALENLPAISDEDVEVLEELEEISAETLAKQGEEAPIIKLVNVLLMSAIQKGASDIHIEPYEKELRVRYRVDGLLYNIMQPPMKFRDAMTSRIKIMAKLDIAEKRLPQDGRIKIRFQDNGQPKDIDFRVSCLPTLFGEKIVMRLLDKDKLMLDMTKLGFEAESLKKFETQIMKPWGMVLVTGPTGSGKTNTLYSSISRINTVDTNIMTAEDPVEFNLMGVNQVQVRENIGLTFAAALRSGLDEGRECGRREDLPQRAQPRHHRVAILRCREIARLDRGRGFRIGGLDAHGAAAFRAQHDQRTRNAGERMQRRRDRVAGEQHDVALHVGRSSGFAGAEEAARISRTHGEQAAPPEHVVEPASKARRLLASRSFTDTGCVQR